MRRWIAVHDVVAFLHEVAFLHRDVFALGHHVFDFDVRIFRGLNRDTTLVFVVLAEPNITVDFRDNGVILGATCLKQFGHTWKTTCNVLSLGAFTRNTRNDVTGLDVLTVLNR